MIYSYPEHIFILEIVQIITEMPLHVTYDSVI